MKILEIIFISIITALIIIIILGIFVGNYLYKLVINSHSDKSVFLGAPHNKTIRTSQKNNQEHFNEPKEWLKKTARKEFMYSFDNLKLNSYVVRSRTESNKWVILCHGYNGNAFRNSYNAVEFYNMGFNILLPDARGHGKSEGDYIGLGWYDRMDIIKYINRIIGENENAQILLYGASMGASTVLMVSGEKLPINIKAIIADCGYSSAWDELSYQLNKFLHLPSFPLLNFMSLMTKINAGYRLEDADTIKQVKKSTVPIFLIHGSEDTFVPTYMMNKIYDATVSLKEKLIIKNAGHVGSSTSDPKLYWDSIRKFIDQHTDILPQ